MIVCNRKAMLVQVCRMCMYIEWQVNTQYNIHPRTGFHPLCLRIALHILIGDHLFPMLHKNEHNEDGDTHKNDK